MVNKIDSNVTGLRFAEESSLKTLPGSPVWYPVEPNSYSDFGGSIVTTARNPITADRQLRKGVVTDLDASGGFNSDVTQTSLTRLLQGFFFADIRQKPCNNPLNGTQIPFTGATSTTYAAASGLTFLANHLVFASGFGVAANNGLKLLSAATATTLTTTGNASETPPAAATVQAVGYQFASATVDIDASGTLPRLVRASGAVDFTTFGLVPGEFVFIGGDTSATRFATAANNGFARVKEVGAAYIEFDKTENTMVDETGTALTIRLFFGNVIKNEVGTDIVRRSYQLERTLGQDSNGTMSEYITGSVPSELTLNLDTADKATVDLSFVSADFEQRDGTTGVKSGARPSLAEADAFNTTSDVRRSKMQILNASNANPTALFGYITDLSLSISNNLTPNKAISVLGAFDITAGDFVVTGDVTAYFTTIDATQSVKNNDSVTVDLIITKNNAGVAFDIPLLTLGDARPNVTKDEPITLPLSIQAAKGSLDHTLLFSEFTYLPTLAM
jgi:hypothetical protein